VVADGGVGRDNLGAGPSVSAQLSGSADDDILVGGPGTADLRGEQGADTLTAGTGPTVLAGGDGPDQLWAGAQTAQIAGELGDDTYRIDPDVVQGSLRLVEAASSGRDTIDLRDGSAPFKLELGDTAPQPVTPALTVELSSVATFEDAIGGSGDDILTGNALPNTLTGLGGGDTFRFGLDSQAFGADTVADFGNGADTVDLLNGAASVSGGLGTPTVTVANGGPDLGTITAANGHLWQAADFS
jgi:Ca2+-binding RTX toxin-like protein